MRSLLRRGRGDPDAWCLVRRRRPLSAGYLAGVGLAVGACVLVPYGEELLRCRRAAGARKRRARAEKAVFGVTEGK
ncbi:hypothetical protein ACIRUL_32040 [Streptomyces sp. NPDC101171]|uniref:hypothetical protein n=1 Tax=Streptomyces sp. NPDC101171 TaxID=3366122 RepID=UPI0037FB6B23